MNITSAQYLQFDGENRTIKVVTDEKTIFVPINTDNTHYQAIQEWVKAGNTIEEAD
tara:strand:+ start:246 stop:413 length:168 start_codon:yes stop_codon:yes gene_type:complete